ncbi:MAG: hypothetical protein ABWY31_03480 [Pseudoxanthomonas sp.]
MNEALAIFFGFSLFFGSSFPRRRERSGFASEVAFGLEKRKALGSRLRGNDG